MAGNWLFIAACVIIVLSVIHGVRVGALRMIWRVCAWFFVLIFMMVMTPKVNTWITDHTGVDEWVSQKITEQVQKKIDEKQTKIEKSVKDVLPENASLSEVQLGEDGSLLDGQISGESIQKTIVTAYDELSKKLPGQIQQIYQTAVNDIRQQTAVTTGAVKTAVNQAETQMVQSVAASVTNLVMHAIALLAAFLLAKIITGIIGHFVARADHNAVIGGASRVLGFFLGLALGFLYVWLVLYVLGIFSFTDWGAAVQNLITQNTFLSYMNTHNPVTGFLRM